MPPSCQIQHLGEALELLLSRLERMGSLPLRDPEVFMDAWVSGQSGRRMNVDIVRAMLESMPAVPANSYNFWPIQRMHAAVGASFRRCQE